MKQTMKLDAYEQEILDSYESGKTVSDADIKEFNRKMKAYLMFTKTSKKSISLRVSENDLHDIKRKSIEIGIPYQNIIQSLIHSFNQGKIRLS